jgi:hypothetical protein
MIVGAAVAVSVVAVLLFVVVVLLFVVVIVVVELGLLVLVAPLHLKPDVWLRLLLRLRLPISLS